MGEIKLDGFLCDRCDHTWASRRNSEQKPTVCPRCKSPYWNIPRKQSYEKKVIESIKPQLKITNLKKEILLENNLFPPGKKSDERFSLFPQKNKDG